MNKTFIRNILVLLITAWISFAHADPGNPVANKNTTSIAPMLSKVMPAIVNVTVLGELPQPPSPYANNNDNNEPEEENPGPQQRKRMPPVNPKFQDMGSGVIVDAKNGYVITNAHVISDAKIITVTLTDGRRYKAKLIGADKLSDIAVLKIEATNLSEIPFANSDNLQVGDFVAAIGNPFGLHETVTSGVISALHRNIGIEGYENFIQTDASINPGNSGGALVNMKGELVGINTALIGPISGNVGIGFAIPINMAHSVMTDLIKYGKVDRGVLGVMVQDLTPALADALNISGTQGALVTNIIPNSPAAKAGLQSEDTITKLNDVTITNASQLRNMIGLLPIGTKVNMAVRRHDKTLNLSAEIMNPKELKMQTQPRMATFLDGVRLMDYDQLVPDLGHVHGLGVLSVDETTDAWLDGLRPGDIILEANNHPVTTVAQLMEVLNGNQSQLLLKVGRGSGIIFLVITR